MNDTITISNNIYDIVAVIIFPSPFEGPLALMRERLTTTLLDKDLYSNAAHTRSASVLG